MTTSAVILGAMMDNKKTSKVTKIWRPRSNFLLGASLLAMLPFSVHAQSADDQTSDQRTVEDPRGVNLASGKIVAPNIPLSIGSSFSGLKYTGGSINIRSYFRYALQYVDNTHLIAVVGGVGLKFTLVNGLWTSDQADGSVLVENGDLYAGGNYTLTLRDGTTVVLDRGSVPADYGIKYGMAFAKSVTFSNGNKWSFFYKRIDSDSINGMISNIRLSSVVDETGYMAKIEYASNVFSNDYFKSTKVYFLNRSVDYCDPNADACVNLTQQWPSITFSQSADGSSRQQSDAMGRLISYSYSPIGGRLTALRRPGAAVDNESVTYDANQRVSSVTVDGLTWQYTWSLAAPVMTVAVTNPDATQHVVTVDTNQNEILTYRDEANATTTYQYDTAGRLTYIIGPGGTITGGVPSAGYTKYTYDGRGNVTELRKVSKTPGTPPDIVTSAGYPASCTNAKTCNEPAWTKDALGNQTDYTYDANHGGVLTATGPADSSGVRPQTRNSYASMQAYYKNSSGSIVASGVGQYVLTGTSTCLSATSTNPASCVGTASESKATIGYGPQSAGSANNLLPITQTAAAGDGSIVAAIGIAYDGIGNAIAVDGPLSGSADTTVYRYNADRELVGVVRPDPDGAGSRVPMAQRTTYNVLGQVTMSEVGTVADQSDAAWSNFNSQQQVVTTYDASARPVQTSVTVGGTTYALVQQNYDGMGRVNCAVTRMDPSQWSGQTDACTPQTSGAYGPDRVTKWTYDAVGRVLTATTGMGTAASAVVKTNAYDTDGLLSSVKDANNNLTAYTYDGFNRLSKTNFPSTTKGANTSSSTDYEQLTYGDNVHVTQRRLRDGNLLSYYYDNLGRIVLVGGDSVADRSYGYNLLGLQTAATFSTGGQSVTHAYDAFGRVTSETTPQGSVTYQYDSASRRTRMSWPDGLYVTYDYDTLGDVAAIRENGAASGLGVLASYSFDDLGRRSSVVYGNGTSRTYAYDTAGRLAGLRVDLAGTGNDLVIGGIGGTGSPISYNPAAQIVGIARSNNAFAYTGGYNVNRGYTTNGLNQYTASGATALGYDGRGNLSSSGSTVYAYNGLNELTGISGGPSAALAYDAADRLYQLDAGGVTTRYLYDGRSMIGEYNGSNALLRRFVSGPGVDEPIVWYEGSGTGDRRWLQADERGSIIAVSDASGNAIGINTYDEFGIPGAANIGRFGYTGQVWLGETGMSYYKARFYSPTLGRFVQTDPIGYGDGLNWYNYVHADPINNSDPSGNSTGAAPDRDFRSYTCATGTRICSGDGNNGAGTIVHSSWGPAAGGPGGGGTRGGGGSFSGGASVSGWGARWVNTSPVTPEDAHEIDANGHFEYFPIIDYVPISWDRSYSPSEKDSSRRGKPQAPKSAPCGSPMDGPVFYRTNFELATVPVVGFSYAQGEFTTGGGGYGTFSTGAFHIGAEAGISTQWGHSPNLDTFGGFSNGFGGGGGVFAGSVSWAESNGRASVSGGAGTGPVLDFGASAFASETDITSFTCRGGR